MKKLRNILGFLIAGVIALGALGVTAGLTLPELGGVGNATDEINQKAKELTDGIAVDPNPKEADIQRYDTVKKQLIDEYAQLIAFYKEHDKFLEAWFDPNTPAAQTMLASTFLNAHDTKSKELDKKILDALPERLGYRRIDRSQPGNENVPFGIIIGFDWETIGNANAVGDAQVMRLVQKRFWIRDHVAKIVLERELSVERLLEVAFLNPIQELDGKADRPLEEANVKYTVFESGFFPASLGGDGRQTALADGEMVLPGALGETITFGVAVMLPYAKVPAFLDRLLKVEANGPLIHPVALRIYQHDQNPIQVTAQAPPDQQEAKQRELEAKEWSRSPVVAVTAYVLDFK
jgi:hypothetical protein